ncbi:hypothetical protein ABFS83_04G095000 [Erythranthe nasuta]
MERARKLVNRAILRRLVSESKQQQPLYRSSRYVSSFSPALVPRGSNVVGKAHSFTFARSISVDALKPSDTFARR